jgi:CRISPR system Cascade subunit CasC
MNKLVKKTNRERVHVIMRKRKKCYVDVHILQTVPPSCVNRDDTGSPKTAVYGGAVRSRVSSQSWKKAVRDMFKEEYPREYVGMRTKRIVGMVADELRQMGKTDEAEKATENVLKAAGLKIKSAEKGTDALFFMSIAQAQALARLVIEDPETATNKPSKQAKDKAQLALKEEPSLDIALFGRMVADNPSLNTDACAQVAHSISTHRIVNEYDYFTAVDDLSPDDNTGAGHIGTVEFNSSTLYRYATIAVHELHKHLVGDTASAISGFVDAFVRSMPTGKQNTFANRTVPDAVLVTLRTDQPVNLVGAFEKPIQAGRQNDNGYVEGSANALIKHAQSLYGNWLDEPKLTLVTGELLSNLGETLPLKDLLRRLSNELDSQLKNGRDV